MSRATKHVLRISLGYEFQSRCRAYSPRELLKSFHEACRVAERTLRRHRIPVSITPQHVCTRQGEPLSLQILELFGDADLAIFEISDLNPNVMYEVGVFSGSRRSPILLRNPEKSKLLPPADLSGLLFHEYSSVRQLTAPLAEKIIAKIKEQWRRTTPLGIWLSAFRSAWFGEKPYSPELSIVCGHVPRRTANALRRTSDPEHESVLATFSDRDSLVEVTRTLALLYPSSHQVRHTSKGASWGHQGDAVTIGGPDFNSLHRWVCKQAHLPFQFETNSRPNAEPILVHVQSGQRFRARVQRRVPRVDYGVFARVGHPNNPGSTIILLSGITSLGVLGAALAFAPTPAAHANIESLLRKSREPHHFCVVTRVERAERILSATEVLWSTFTRHD